MTYVVYCQIHHPIEGYINFAQWRVFSSLAATGPWIAGMFHTCRVYLLYSSSFSSDLSHLPFFHSYSHVLAVHWVLLEDRGQTAMIEGTLPRFQAAWGWLWAWQAGMTSVLSISPHSILLVDDLRMQGGITGCPQWCSRSSCGSCQMSFLWIISLWQAKHKIYHVSE